MQSKQAQLYKTNRTYNNLSKHKIAVDMLERYTGSDLKDFQKQIILTNFDYYIERFKTMDGTVATKGSAMNVAHNEEKAVTIIDFSIGSPNAALIIELLSVVDASAVLFLGM